MLEPPDSTRCGRHQRHFPAPSAGEYTESTALPSASVGDPSRGRVFSTITIDAELAAASLLEQDGVDLGTDVRVETETAFGSGLAFEDEMLQRSVFPK